MRIEVEVDAGLIDLMARDMLKGHGLDPDKFKLRFNESIHSGCGRERGNLCFVRFHFESEDEI